MIVKRVEVGLVVADVDKVCEFVGEARRVAAVGEHDHAPRPQRVERSRRPLPHQLDRSRHALVIVVLDFGRVVITDLQVKEVGSKVLRISFQLLIDQFQQLHNALDQREFSSEKTGLRTFVY